MKREFVTQGETETRELGRRLGIQLQPGTVIGLSGTLGAGKTRLTQGIGLGLGVPSDSIVSPTFTLCVPYQGRLRLLHLDAYRIQDPSEIDELGLDEAVEDGAVLIIEWHERFAAFFPPLDLRINLELIDDQGRRVIVENLTERICVD